MPSPRKACVEAERREEKEERRAQQLRLRDAGKGGRQGGREPAPAE